MRTEKLKGVWHASCQAANARMIFCVWNARMKAMHSSTSSFCLGSRAFYTVMRLLG